VWQQYRTAIDSKLPSLGLAHHVEAIELNLRSENPAQWRLTAYACRNLIQDLGRDLWKVPGKTYPRITNDKGKPIEVTEDKFANRISAYLHEKAIGDTERKLIVAEADAISRMIAALPAALGSGHAPMTRGQARSMAIATYVFVGELVTKTDMSPVERLTPSVSDGDAAPK
jgi:hypothetical protein